MLPGNLNAVQRQATDDMTRVLGEISGAHTIDFDVLREVVPALVAMYSPVVRK